MATVRVIARTTKVEGLSNLKVTRRIRKVKSKKESPTSVNSLNAMLKNA